MGDPVALSENEARDELEKQFKDSRIIQKQKVNHLLIWDHFGTF